MTKLHPITVVAFTVEGGERTIAAAGPIFRHQNGPWDHFVFLANVEDFVFLADARMLQWLQSKCIWAGLLVIITRPREPSIIGVLCQPTRAELALHGRNWTYKSFYVSGLDSTIQVCAPTRPSTG